MYKKYSWAIYLMIGVAVTTVYGQLSNDKALGNDNGLVEYTLFDSTLKIQTPFPIKEEEADNPNPEMIDKASSAGYNSKNILFIISAYRLRSGVKFKDLDKGVTSLLAYLDKHRNGHSIISNTSNIIINGVSFKEYTGVQKLTNNSVVNKVKDFNFKALVSSNSKYVYSVYLDENVNSGGANALKQKIFNSIIIK